MKAWLSQSQIGQRPGLAIAAASAAIITLVPLIFSLAWLLGRTGDRAAVIGNFLSLGTFLLALAAGIVALAACSAATGLPVLRVKVSTPTGYTHDVHIHPDAAYGDSDATIVVRNSSKFAARTPAVIVHFVNCGIAENIWVTYQGYGGNSGWTPTAFSPGAGPQRKVLAIQWDGGPNYAIHGDSERYLPVLSLDGLTGLLPDQDAFIGFTLLADGYRYVPKTGVHVTFSAETTETHDGPPEPDSDWL